MNKLSHSYHQSHLLCRKNIRWCSFAMLACFLQITVAVTNTLETGVAKSDVSVNVIDIATLTDLGFN
ncbi:MAG: hypothetical protein KUG82_14610 [Pseudomonadales bacterium]|nr:hypothetical protein [Pseudomonadales bacterium]